MEFAWTTCEETYVITAPNYDRAYEATITQRIEAGETREEAIAHARKNDTLSEIAGSFTVH